MSSPARTSARSVALVFVGGTFGCATRGALGLLFPATGFPWTTLVINVTGAFLLGLLLTLLAGRGPGTGVRLFLGTGFLGGYTTYSTLATDTVLMLGGGTVWAGLLYAVATLVLGAVMTWSGMVIAARLRRATAR